MCDARHEPNNIQRVKLYTFVRPYQGTLQVTGPLVLLRRTITKAHWRTVLVGECQCALGIGPRISSEFTSISMRVPDREPKLLAPSFPNPGR